MKPTFAWTMRSFFFFCFLSLFTLVTSAQETPAQETGTEKATTTTTTTSRNTDVNITSANNSDAWYAQPWVWIVGAALFILLLVALLNGRSRDTVSTSDRVTVKKTVERDSGSNV